MAKKLIRLPAVTGLVGLPKPTIYRLAKEGRFPAPIKLSDSASAWIEEEVLAWVDARIEASRERPAQNLKQHRAAAASAKASAGRRALNGAGRDCSDVTDPVKLLSGGTEK